MQDQESDRDFGAAQAWFAISVLRQSRAKATSRPFVEGDVDETLDALAAEAHRRLLEHLASLPDDGRQDATNVILWAMIREHLHVTTHRPAEWRRT